MKLILGTAEFAPQGYADIGPVLHEEKIKILSCAKEVGINIIDTADSYNCHEFLKTYAKGFCIYTKTRNWTLPLDWGDNELRGILYHYQECEGRIKFPFIHRWVNLGASVYTREQLPEQTQVLQIPFNIMNSKFIDCFNTYRTVFVRSVFGRGALLSSYSIGECLDFVKKYRPDGIIVGVKTAQELEEIVKAYGND